MIKKMVVLSIAMLMVCPEMFANIGGKSLNVIGSHGSGIQKVITPVEQFHTSGMSKHPNMLEQGQWISVTYQAGVKGEAPVKRGAALKLISSKAVKPGMSGGMMINVYEAVTAGRARLTLSNGAIYKFAVEGAVMHNDEEMSDVNSGYVGGVTYPGQFVPGVNTPGFVPGVNSPIQQSNILPNPDNN